MNIKWGAKVVAPSGEKATVIELDPGTLLDTQVVFADGHKAWFENDELTSIEA